jgi:hypothetical protein
MWYDAGMENKRISLSPPALSASMEADMRQIAATMGEACERIREREAARWERRAKRIAEKRPLKGLLVRKVSK